MQPDPLQTALSWASAILLYPGLLFAAALALLGEWLFGLLRPLLTPALYRTHAARATSRNPFQPLYTALRLAGRRTPAHWPTNSSTISPNPALTPPTTPGTGILNALSIAAPILALALLPLPGSPLNRANSPTADILTILLLLTLGPLLVAASRLLSGRLTPLQGTRDLGRILTGLLPITLAVAALVEVSGTRSLSVASLTAAPQTAPQTIVRLLAGAVLLVALPWWHGWRNDTPTRQSAGSYASHILQTAALAAFWTTLVIPAPGNTTWAIAAFTLSALLSYLIMRAVPHLWFPVRRETDAANLLWSTALPTAAMALLISLLTGA